MKAAHGRPPQRGSRLHDGVSLVIGSLGALMGLSAAALLASVVDDEMSSDDGILPTVSVPDQISEAFIDEG
ncbi:hypothetical protein [Streptomyces sp. NPDC059003]|uniref:hypothetical protein n=1 Tax=Streptomyces sp. NPDC059003 TaxID=3346691 RepID=UPI0036AD5F30